MTSGQNALSPELQIHLLKHQLRVANAEIAKLRRRLNESGVLGRRLDRAWADALLLAELHVAYQPTTREHAVKCAGLTDHRWENARALLILARVHNGRQWLAHDLGTIEAALSRAKEKALDTPAAYLARLPKHARPDG